MSFTQVILQKDGTIHAISDKRLGQGAYVGGEIVDWKLFNDEQVKIHKLAEKCILNRWFCRRHRR